MKPFLHRLRRLFSMRHVIWFLFSLVTLIAVLIAVGNWTGARRWADVKAQLQRKGETLDFKSLLPHPIADSRNFCAIEPLRGITLVDDEKSAVANKRRALETLAKIQAKPTVPTAGGPALGHRMDFRAWAKFARESKLIDSPTDTPADLLQAFDHAYPLAKELAEATLTRPEAAFLPTLRERTLPKLLFSLPVPHYSSAQQAARALRLRAALALEAGDIAGTTQSIQAIFRFSAALLKEPLLISYLVSLSIHDLGEEALWSLLEKRAGTETDLAGLQTSLQQLDLFEAELTAMRSELCMGIEAIEFIQNNPASADPLLATMNVPNTSVFAVARYLIPSGFYDHNKAKMAELYSEYFIQPLNGGNMTPIRTQAKQLPAHLQAHRGPWHPDYVLANIAMPAIAPIIDRSCGIESIRRQAMLACALERFFIQHQKYPGSLTELTPTFITSLPKDPMDNQPMRYRLTKAGRYALWSIGFDLKDDGGQVNPKPNDKFALGVLFQASYQGDWAWQYEEVK